MGYRNSFSMKARSLDFNRDTSKNGICPKNGAILGSFERFCGSHRDGDATHYSSISPASILSGDIDKSRQIRIESGAKYQLRPKNIRKRKSLEQVDENELSARPQFQASLIAYQRLFQARTSTLLASLTITREETAEGISSRVG